MNRLPDPREHPWLTVAELAELTGEGEKAIRAALDAGQLPLLRIGRYTRIPTAALMAQLGIDPEDTEADSSTEPATATVHHLTPRSGEPQHGPEHPKQSSTPTRDRHPVGPR